MTKVLQTEIRFHSLNTEYRSLLSLLNKPFQMIFYQRSQRHKG